MKKIVLIIVIITMLLSGCLSGGNKSGSNNTGNSGDEYGTDNSVEEDDSGIIRADYRSLDLNSTVPDVSNVKSKIYTNTTIDTVGKTAV